MFGYSLPIEPNRPRAPPDHCPECLEALKGLPSGGQRGNADGSRRLAAGRCAAYVVPVAVPAKAGEDSPLGRVEVYSGGLSSWSRIATVSTC
jgi:hypothetical protein